MSWGSLLKLHYDRCFPCVGTRGHAALTIRAAHHHWRHRGGRPARLRRQPELVVGRPQRGLQRQLWRRGWPPRAWGTVCPPVVSLTYTEIRPTFCLGRKCMSCRVNKDVGQTEKFGNSSDTDQMNMLDLGTWNCWLMLLTGVLGLFWSMSEELALGQSKTFHCTWNRFRHFKQQLQVEIISCI